MEWATTLVVVALLGTVVGAALLAFAVYLGVNAVRNLIASAKGEPIVPLFPAGKKPQFQYLDESSCTAADVERVLRKYANADVVGTFAREGLSALEANRAKGARFYAVLESKFAKGSLSWEKFSSAAVSVSNAVLRNCTLLANRVQAFDAADFRDNERAFRPALLRPAVSPTPAQAQKRALHQSALNEMGALTKANTELLVELDRLASELDKLDNIGSGDASARVVDEIRSLINETKYYTSKLNEM